MVISPLLIFDGHGSHITFEFVSKYFLHNVLLFASLTHDPLAPTT